MNCVPNRDRIRLRLAKKISFCETTRFLFDIEWKLYKIPFSSVLLQSDIVDQYLLMRLIVVNESQSSRLFIYGGIANINTGITIA